MFHRRALIAAIALGFLLIAVPTYAQDESIVVASTTSTQDSGLFEYLLPITLQSACWSSWAFSPSRQSLAASSSYEFGRWLTASVLIRLRRRLILSGYLPCLALL